MPMVTGRSLKWNNKEHQNAKIILYGALLQYHKWVIWETEACNFTPNFSIASGW